MMTGYEALRSAAASLDLTGRGLIRMTGEDRARLLHAMSTNEIKSLNPGEGCYCFFLNAQGRILADANVFVFAESILLDTEPQTGNKIREHLDRFIIADDVTLEDESSQWAVIAVEGPTSAEALRAIDCPVPERPLSTELWKEGFVGALSFTGLAGFRIYAPVAAGAELKVRLADCGVVEASPEEARTVRIEQGKPRYGDDITERYLTQETNQMQAVSFSKGCYLGQEIVERVRSRAQIHRLLTPVRIHSQSPPPPGAKLTAAGKDAGEITSAVYSPAAGEVVALAYVRVEQIQAKPELVVAGSEPAARASLN